MPDDEEFLRATLPALDLVYNLARRLVGRQPDVEDLVQETYLRAWIGWTAGRPPRRVEAWLATICLNAGRDQLRRAGRRREIPASDAGTTWDRPGTGDVEGEAIARAWREQVERALWGLPVEQRIAIVLMDLCGFTAAEVATLTGSPRGTVLARVHRGRKALARLIPSQEVDHRAP